MLKSYLTILAALFLVSGAFEAWAESGKKPRRRTYRTYSDRLQLHDVHLPSAAPTENGEEVETGPDMEGFQERPLGTEIGPGAPVVPRVSPPLRSEPEKKNWIVPLGMDGESEFEFDVEEEEPSGWGWLADEMEKAEPGLMLGDDQAERAEREEDAEEQAERRGDEQEERADEEGVEPVAPSTAYETEGFRPMLSSDLGEASGERVVNERGETSEEETYAAVWADGEDREEMTEREIWDSDHAWEDTLDEAALPPSRTEALLSEITDPIRESLRMESFLPEIDTASFDTWQPETPALPGGSSFTGNPNPVPSTFPVRNDASGFSSAPLDAPGPNPGFQSTTPTRTRTGIGAQLYDSTGNYFDRLTGARDAAEVP